MRKELLLDTSLVLRMKVFDLHQLFGYFVQFFDTPSRVIDGG
jgi:hypothetical protein